MGSRSEELAHKVAKRTRVINLVRLKRDVRSNKVLWGGYPNRSALGLSKVLLDCYDKGHNAKGEKPKIPGTPKDNTP